MLGSDRDIERIGELLIARDFATEALHRLSYGLMLIDAGINVHFANSAAKSMLARSNSLRLQLSTHRTIAANGLLRLIIDATRGGAGGSVAISHDGIPSMLATVLPLQRDACRLTCERPCAILIIKDLERPAKRSLAAFSEFYGLTPAQLALANELIIGDGIDHAATRLGVSRATVRTHLIHIFQKTGTKRQAELIRLMLEWTQEINLT